MNNKKVLHITLAKCGSQWIRDILTAPEITRYSRVPYSGISKSIHNNNQIELPNNALSGPIYGMNQWEWLYWKEGGDKAIVVLRDPRDVIVSLYYSWIYSHALNPQVEEMRALLLNLPNEIDRWKFMIAFLRADLRVYITWLSKTIDSALVIKYEDLLLNPVDEITKLIEWLGWNVPNNIIKEVVDRLSFQSKSGRDNGKVDKYSHYRKGISGDWKNHFCIELGKYWEELYPNFLMEIGYEDNYQWWQFLPKQQNDASEQIGSKDVESELVDIMKNRNKVLEKELIEKEKVIQGLVDACTERLTLINQLTNN
jgi:hypothetical protein